MERAIQRVLEEAPYNVHVFVKDANTNHYFIQEKLQAVFFSASLIKVPILLGVLHYLEGNNQDIHQEIKVAPKEWVDYSVISEQRIEQSTIYELLVWMIITSDNTATNVLIDFIGIDVFNHYFSKIGLHQTKLQRKMMDFEKLERGIDNLTSANDMAHLFSRIYQQDLLSTKFSKLTMDILSRQRVMNH